jgi:glycosyltransferase involved in cell wall biosynthesis
MDAQAIENIIAKKSTPARPLRVVHSTLGTFYFNLTRELQKRGHLEAVFSTFPRWKLRNQGIAPEKLHVNPWLHGFLMLKWRYGLEHRQLDWRLVRWMLKQQASYVINRLPECDLLVGLSSSGLEAGREVQRRGGKYVVDRGSAHIAVQTRLLEEEFRLWGQEYNDTDPYIVDREVEEYAQADCITVPSMFAGESFLEMGVPAKKVRVLPFGVNRSIYKKDADPPRDEFKVLFVGTVSFQKGIPYLLKAFKQLRHPGKRLILIGAMATEMKTHLRNDPLDGVEILGPMPALQVIHWMSTSHVLVLPSIQDGFGQVLAEAMACGCPCISTVHTGGPDLYRHGREGFIVPIRDAFAIAQSLEQLAQNMPLRQRMSEAAMDRVVELGGTEQYGNQCCQLYHELTAGGTVSALP